MRTILIDVVSISSFSDLVEKIKNEEKNLELREGYSYLWSAELCLREHDEERYVNSNKRF